MAERGTDAAVTAAQNPGNTLQGRLEADDAWPFGRVLLNPDADGCCAVLKLGKFWARFGSPVLCSRRALPDNIFCGLHDHLTVLCGMSSTDEFVSRALKRAHLRGAAGLRVFREADRG